MTSPNCARAEPALPRTTGALAAALNAELSGPADLPIRTIATLEDAGPDAITFVRSPKYARQWAASGAAAALVSRGIDLVGHDAARRAVLTVPDADAALIELLKLFDTAPPAPAAGVHPTAIIDPTAKVDPTVHIGPHCTVGAGTQIGAGCVIRAGVHIGAVVVLGAGCTLHPGVVLYDRTWIGRGCTIHAGAIIGADGFGYRPRPDGRGVVKIPHIGRVHIEDDVEIGANACIDRAKFGATFIGAGTKIDNLVQIGHNVRIGRACIICGLTGIAGSVTLGDGVMVGGLTGIADNLDIGAGCKIGAKAGVMNDLAPGTTAVGYPALPRTEYMRPVRA